MGTSMPMYFPSGFNLTDAQTCAAMVNAAYDQYDQFSGANYPEPANFDWVWTGPSNISNPLPIWWIKTVLGVTVVSEPIGFLATDGAGNAYLVFRGTMTDADKAADADYGQTAYALVSNFGNAFSGYYDIYTDLSLPTAPSGQTTLIGAVNALTGVSTFFFTGHSMGSGLSSLAVPDISTNSSITPASATMVHYNFATPRPGDPSFAAAINATSVPTYRVVNTEDLVPLMAPPPVNETVIYQHIGTPVDFSVNYGSTVGNHSMANTYTYAVNNPSDPYNNSSNADATPRDGTGALSWNVVVTPAVGHAAAV